MIIKKVSTASLVVKENTRMQCMFNCLHYKVNPKCPPSAPEIKWFKELIAAHEHAEVFYEIMEYDNQLDMYAKRKAFQTKVLEFEHIKKREGYYYALVFHSGPCSQCGDSHCKLSSCNRWEVGRTPLCGTGIDIQKLCEQLEISTEDSILYWNQTFSKSIFQDKTNKVLMLSIVFY